MDTDFARRYVALTLPEAPVVEPQFKVLVGGKQAGMVVLRGGRYHFFVIGDTSDSRVSSDSIFDLVLALESRFSAVEGGTISYLEAFYG
jgi:hypothetical protein